MSRITIIAIVLAAIGTAGIIAWSFVPSGPRQESGATTPSAQPASDAGRLERREKFFGGDPDRDVRGGQEMKPRW